MSDKKAGGQQMRFSEEEVDILRNTFRGNARLLKLLRKVFLPELDPDAPIGQMVDLWFVMNPSELTPEDAYVNIKARNNLIAHVEQQLMQLEFLANIADEDPVAKAERKAKDTTK